MLNQFLHGNEIQAIFEQMGGGVLAQRRKVNLFSDCGLFQRFTHYPRQETNYVLFI